MKNITFCSLLAASVIYTGCTVKERGGLSKGSYLSKAYIKLLIDTRSPRIAGDSIGAEFFTEIASDSNSHLTILMGDIHSTVGFFRIDDSGRVIYPEEYAEYSGTIVRATSPTTFTLITPAHSPVDYVFVGDGSRWAGTTLLKGDYVDSSGSMFTFSDSVFSLPTGEKYIYRVDLDCWGGPPQCDCLLLDRRAYHFFFSTDTLKIFEYYGRDDSSIRETPKWVLMHTQRRRT